jgi:hypothetical protein
MKTSIKGARHCFVVGMLGLWVLAGCQKIARPTPPPETGIELRELEFNARPARAPCRTSLGRCPDEGCGDDARLDAVTNRQKNRTTVPDQFEFMTVPTFKHEFREITTIGKSRKDLPDAEEATIEANEDHGVEVEGYVLDDTREGPESCNCYLPDALDYHLWLGQRASSTKPDSIVVELTPRVFDTAEITELMARLKRDKVHVRVIGWPFFDPLHPEQIGRTRSTRWEVHPVLDIEEEVDGAWQSVFE